MFTYISKPLVSLLITVGMTPMHTPEYFHLYNQSARELNANPAALVEYNNYCHQVNSHYDASDQLDKYFCNAFNKNATMKPEERATQVESTLGGFESCLYRGGGYVGCGGTHNWRDQQPTYTPTTNLTGYP